MHTVSTCLDLRDLQHHPAQAPPLDDEQYRDLTIYLGARDGRTSRAVLDHDSFSPAIGTTALVEQDSAAWFQQDGSTLHTGPASTDLHSRLIALTEDWNEAGQPPASCWWVEFDHQEYLDPPLLRPLQWRLQ